MRRRRLALYGMGLVLGIVLLSGCAEKLAVYDWYPKDKALGKYHQVLVEVEAKKGLDLPQLMLERLVVLINQSFTTYAGKLTPVAPVEAGEGTLAARVIITRYDDGAASARLPFQEPGNMYIDGKVILSDWLSSKKLAAFDVSQIFDRLHKFGGVASIDDLEPEFAQKVVTGITLQAQ